MTIQELVKLLIITLVNAAKKLDDIEAQKRSSRKPSSKERRERARSLFDALIKEAKEVKDATDGKELSNNYPGTPTIYVVHWTTPQSAGRINDSR